MPDEQFFHELAGWSMFLQNNAKIGTNDMLRFALLVQTQIWLSIVRYFGFVLTAKAHRR